MDASSAVDAARANLGEQERLHLAQADLFDLPFDEGAFDRVLCFGVLQHTPDPRRAFLTASRVRRVARRRRLPQAAVRRPLVGEDPVAAAHDAPAARSAPPDRRVVRAALAACRHASRARSEARPLPDGGRALLELHRAATRSTRTSSSPGQCSTPSTPLARATTSRRRSRRCRLGAEAGLATPTSVTAGTGSSSPDDADVEQVRHAAAPEQAPHDGAAATPPVQRLDANDLETAEERRRANPRRASAGAASGGSSRRSRGSGRSRARDPPRSASSRRRGRRARAVATSSCIVGSSCSSSRCSTTSTRNTTSKEPSGKGDGRSSATSTPRKRSSDAKRARVAAAEPAENSSPWAAIPRRKRCASRSP